MCVLEMLCYHMTALSRCFSMFQRDQKYLLHRRKSDYFLVVIKLFRLFSWVISYGFQTFIQYKMYNCMNSECKSEGMLDRLACLQPLQSDCFK